MSFIDYQANNRILVMTKGHPFNRDDFFAVVEAFPESARWQLLMLLYDIEKLDSVKTTVESFQKFSKSSSRLADSADKLPEKLRMGTVLRPSKLQRQAEPNV